MKRQLNGYQKQMYRMRSVVLGNKSSEPRTKVRKSEFIDALRGTGGVLKTIAANLGIGRITVKKYLEKEGWEDVRRFWEDEVEALSDDAVGTLRYTMRQRADLVAASQTARWYLSKIDRDRFGDKQDVTVHGGKPMRVNTVSVGIPVDSLELPLELRRQLLAACDEREEEEKRKENVPVVGKRTIVRAKGRA